MIHQLNSLYPVRYTAFALCVFGLLLSLFALVAFHVGLPVVLVPGSELAMKVTRPLDLRIAELLLEEGLGAEDCAD